MNLRLIVITAVLLLLGVSCDNMSQGTEVKVSDIDLYAYGKNLTWELNDSILVFDGFSNLLYHAEAAGDTVKFVSSSLLDEDVLDLYALYPYSTSAHRTDRGLAVNVLDKQDVSVDAMNKASEVFVSYTDDLDQNTRLRFNEICSYIKFSVDAKASVVNVTFTGGEGEYLAGEVEVTFSNKEPQISIIDATNSVAISSSSPMSGQYKICLLPAVLQNGLTVTFMTSDGDSVEKKIVAQKIDGIESALVLVRGRVNREVIDFGNPFKRPSDETPDNPSDDSNTDSSGDNDSNDDKPSDDKPSDETPDDDKPENDEPGTDNPSDDNPSEEKPGTDDPSDDEYEKDEPSDDDSKEDDKIDIGSSAEGYDVIIKDNLWN